MFQNIKDQKRNIGLNEKRVKISKEKVLLTKYKMHCVKVRDPKCGSSKEKVRRTKCKNLILTFGASLFGISAFLRAEITAARSWTRCPLRVHCDP